MKNEQCLVLSTEGVAKGMSKGHKALVLREGLPALATNEGDDENIPVSEGILNIVAISQAAYDLLTPVDTTLYVITA